MNIESHILPPSPGIPNNPRLPLLIYRRALPPDVENLTRALEERFSKNGWTGLWRNGILRHHHYHSNAHEVLGVAAGWAKVQFGGSAGEIHSLEAGDVAILPAGTGHKLVDSSSDLLVVGGCPAGQEDYDMMRADEDQAEDALKRIEQVELPQSDPVFGRDGPLLVRWAKF